MKLKNSIDYFEMFEKNSNFALECCKILREYILNFDLSRAQEIEDKVHSIENDADSNQHTVLNYLIKDFLPPIDREDIISLSHKIDDVVDEIDEIAINFNILNIKELREDVKEFFDLLFNCCESLTKMFNYFKNLKNYKQIKEIVIEINKIEEKGDALYQKAIKNLYENEKNAIEVIKWTTIYNCLEDCFDSCEMAADCVEEILMKNS